MNPLEKLSQELVDIVTNEEGGVTAKVTELSNCLSARISEAINPIDNITAPFAIMVLHQYAERISKCYPEAQDAVEALKHISQTATFAIPTKQGEDHGQTEIR